jgi:hypothetical protein
VQTALASSGAVLSPGCAYKVIGYFPSEDIFLEADLKIAAPSFGAAIFTIGGD